METNPPSEVSTDPPGNNLLATVSLVLSVTGFPLLCLTVLFGVLCGCPTSLMAIAAITTGLIARQQILSTGEDGDNLALIGMLLGAVQLLLAVFGMIISIFLNLAPLIIQNLPGMQH